MTDNLKANSSSQGQAHLEAEIQRLNKVVEVLMDRSEHGVNSEASDFSLFQTTVMLEDKVRQRTEELQQAMRQLDISNQALEQSLQNLHETQQQLVESEKMAALGHLVAGVAHEINTPVGVGVTATSHLREQTRIMAAQVAAGELTRSALQRYLNEMAEGTELVQGNLQRAHELIQRFKQTAVDQATHEKRRFELKELVRDIFAGLRPRLLHQSVTVKVEAAEPIWIDSYPGVLTQILTNLTINSLEHGFPDEQSGHIRILLAFDGRQVSLKYQDDGRGIDQEVIGHVFEPFYTTRRHQGGTGLGLHICYNLCTEMLSGTLECQNLDTGGVEFHLRFPQEISTPVENGRAVRTEY